MALIEEIQVGQSASYDRVVTAEDIDCFAELSGDNNPVHLDEDFAKQTIFNGRIAHGMLAASFISTTVGTKLPGFGSIYVSQILKFKAPVRIGDKVKTKAIVKSVDKGRKRVVMETLCYVQDKIVLEGEAELMLIR